MTRKTVALVPIKAKSERVRAKNFKTFAGRPLFHWVISTLLAMDEIEVVVINTDAEDKLKEHGLNELDAGNKLLLRHRREEICGDHVSMNLVIADDLAAIEADRYVMTHATNPLISAKTISSALQAYDTCLRDGSADSLFTVNRVQTRFYREDGSAVNHDPDNLLRTQDLEPWFEENSNLYIFDRSSFTATGARIGKAPCLFESPKLESLDIDNAEDWVLAEALAMRSLP
ncbi:acylneuraminate cytidylyltransferase family protein [Aestuariicoccus sp. MJ-SS9]|uniref:acylneuraminate cytidylyltransferase family protein n=1 Tax=Aestuariicoccus sp. MJ-SS9 TaxID=3079855 RepID=UPI0029123245|nr:acylneuraminate cytidylyltransferase family protein [Aestuariicoccus sp. MJ-SS9]MDU8913290.1 acylneuraminate cytidylyltransferase family protein [Aestuariicoccus sp. MJ-SS9]